MVDILILQELVVGKLRKAHRSVTMDYATEYESNIKAKNMMDKIQWIDLKAIERDDTDENFGLFDFLFWGSRWVKKHAW